MVTVEDRRTSGAVGAPTGAAAFAPSVRPGGDQTLRTNGGQGGAAVQLDNQLRERRSGFEREVTRRVAARVRRLCRGPFDAIAIAEDPADSFGLLVLDGLIAVDLGVGRAQVSWLIGAEDLIRPWDMGESSLTAGASWHAVTNARVALLDGEFSRRASGVPEASPARWSRGRRRPATGCLLSRCSSALRWSKSAFCFCLPCSPSAGARSGRKVYGWSCR